MICNGTTWCSTKLSSISHIGSGFKVIVENSNLGFIGCERIFKNADLMHVIQGGFTQIREGLKKDALGDVSNSCSS